MTEFAITNQASLNRNLDLLCTAMTPGVYILTVLIFVFLFLLVGYVFSTSLDPTYDSVEQAEEDARLEHFADEMCEDIA